MKATKLFFTLLLLFSFMSLYAQDQADAMKKWQDYMTPGPVHQSMAKMVGNWNAEITNYMGGQEMKAEGTAVYEMILGGRYLKGTFKATMMGMPMEGLGIDAYDNGTQEFISVWMDNFGTGVMMLKGKWDDATKSIIYLGSSYDPMAGQDAKVKTVLKMEGDDKAVFDMYMVQDGKDIKNMTVVYYRVK